MKIYSIYKKINFILVFSLVFSVNILSNDYQKIITHVNNTPLNVTGSTSKLSSYLCSPYKTEIEKFAAIYYWIAKNISYNQELAAKPLYYENVDEIVEYVITKKNGVCQHYAELFANLSKQAGLKAFVVNGYTRSNDKVDDLSHAWNIVKAEGKWYFIDATWASSATKTISKNQFPYRFFMVTPEESIKNRMPFDPIWQALSNPINYNDFDKGAVYEIEEGNFNYNDSIETYAMQNQIEQHKSLVRRIKSNGTFNKLVKREYAIMENNYNMLLYNQEVVKYNQGTQNYNKGMHFYNQYARIKNNRTLFYKKSKRQLISIIDSATYHLNKSKILFSKVETNDSGMLIYIEKNKESVQKIIELLKKERKYIESKFN